MIAHPSDERGGTAIAAPHPTEASPPRRTDADAVMHIRASDLEPYVGLRYLSKLFKFMAIIIVLLLIAEVVTGLLAQGRAAIPTLLAEGSRLIVLAGLLWGVGDLAILLIDMGHDLRATRILVGRQSAHHIAEHHLGPAPSGATTHRDGGTPHRRTDESGVR